MNAAQARKEWEGHRLGNRVALECAQKMREFFRDTTFGNIPRTYAHLYGDEEWIEYIPDPIGTLPPFHTVVDGIFCPFA